MTSSKRVRALARLSAANPVPDDAVRRLVPESWSNDLLERVLREPVDADGLAHLSRGWAWKRERCPPVPRLALLAIAVLIGTLIAAPALGLPQRLIQLFSGGKPASGRVELAFSTLDRGAPAGLESGVIPGTARKALDARLPEGARARLWVAPTANGGFCELIELVDATGPRGASGPGCESRANVTGYGLTIPGPVGRRGIVRGPVALSGYVNIRRAERAAIQFEDGTEVQMRLTWISEPIAAAFFVYGVPRRNWEPGRRPSELRYLDAEANVVGARHAIRFGPSAGGTATP